MVRVKRYSYWVYVLGVFVAWAIVLPLAWLYLSAGRFDHLLIFAGGFLLGVLAASLARKIYR